MLSKGLDSKISELIKRKKEIYFDWMQGLRINHVPEIKKRNNFAWP
jgi:hypothetical protein